MHIVYHIIDKPIKGILWFTLRMHSFGVIWIRISDPRSLRSWYIKGTDESMTRVDSSVPLMHHDPDRSWITDLDPDHPKGMHPLSCNKFAPVWYRSFSVYFYEVQMLTGCDL